MKGSISRRLFLKACIFGSLALFLPRPAYSFNRSEHDEITEEILFGHKYGGGENSKKLRGLESAVYLCVDQKGGNGANDLQRLAQLGVPNLPKLEKFALTHIFYGSHDAYTHMGWDFDYSDPAGDKRSSLEGLQQIDYGDDWPERWQLRKNLLINSVAHLLEFGVIDRMRAAMGWANGTRCDAFARLLYCIHVLGDYQYNVQENIKKGVYEVNLLAVPFAVEGASADNRDLFWDLEEAVKDLFDNEGTRERYERLEFDLRKRAKIARGKVAVSSKSSAESFRKNIILTRRLLKKHLPGLLARTSFFNEVFS